MNTLRGAISPCENPASKCQAYSLIHKVVHSAAREWPHNVIFGYFACHWGGERRCLSSVFVSLSFVFLSVFVSLSFVFLSVFVSLSFNVWGRGSVCERE